ncbi:hypothetical protein DITRI_Ditri09bG0039700 [Diplodiscus trichospermus]
MATFKFLVLILLLQSILLVEFNSGEKIFDVVSFGAIGDGKADDTQAFNHAWDAACNSSSPTFLVPQGRTFLLQPLTFNGKCNSNKTTFQIDGKIMAPSNPFAWKCVNDSTCQQWISFEHFDNLVIRGSGIINGQGKEWWNLSCEKNEKGFVLEHCKNVKISGLTFEDSPKMHIAFERSTLIYATNLTIKAPEDSPNTDGIHIQQSTDISIDNSIIQTGDDCISIGHGSKYLNISNIKCGPGHGISIGSLGREGKTEEVEFVHVRDCSFNGTTNGVRIKTWQGGHGYARNMVFERITSHASTRPIIIDQYYCPHKHCENKTSAVEVSNIAYSQISGTTRKKTAVELSCSKSLPCKNITMKDINLRNEEEEESISSYCLNVEGLSNRSVYPNVACLQLVDNF